MLTKKSLKQHKEELIITLITAFGAVIRMINLGTADLWRDEAFSARAAQKPFGDLVNTLANDTAPPLHTILIHFWMNIFGESEFSIRFPSLIFGVLLLPLVYNLAFIVTQSKRLSTAALVLAAVNPVLIFYSQEARSYSLLVFLSTFTLYLSVKIARQKAITNLEFALLTLSTLAGFYTHNLFVFLAFPSFLITLEPKFEQLKKLKKPDSYLIRLIASYVLSFGLFIPWFFILLEQMAKVKDEGFWLTFDPLLRPLEVLVNSFNGVVHYFDHSIGMTAMKLTTAFGLVSFVLASIWLTRNIERTKKPLRYIVFWLSFVMAISWAYSYASTPVMYIRYMIFVVPVVLILSVLSLNFRNRKLFYLSLGTLILLVYAQLVVHSIYLKEIVNTKEDMNTLVSDLKYEEGDLILQPHAYTHHAFNFYSDKPNYIYNPKRDLPYFEGLALVEEKDYYQRASIDDGERIWVIYLWNADDTLTKELSYKYEPVNKTSYKGNLHLELWQRKN